MFLGSFEPNINEQGRIALPKKIREELIGSKIILTTGFEKCIFGFSEKDWYETTKPELSRPLFSDKEGRDLRRKMYSEAISISVDAQGRVVIPEKMLKFSEIDNSLVVIGAGDHFEIWSKNKWEDYMKTVS